MDLSFAKNSKIFSTAVEQLRKEKLPIDQKNIKERYELLESGAEPVAVIVPQEVIDAIETEPEGFTAPVEDVPATPKKKRAAKK